MLGAVGTLVSVGPAAALFSPGLTSSASVTLSSLRAGAAPVELTLTLGYEMQCGYPGPGPVSVELPQAERLPPRATTLRVLVDGHAADGVSVSGHTVSVALAPAPRIMCDVIGPGRLVLEFPAADGLGNPARAGSYRVLATRATSAFTARFTLLAG
jgi:hypothetical protein